MTTSARTEKLYLRDPYASAFEATVLSCDRDADGRFAAVLDATCFYPESGGQPSDRGVLGGAEVLEVQEDENGVVRHYLSAPVENGPVSGRIDWERRFDHMQQHTGQHVLSRAFIDAGGLETVSFHLGAEICTIDLEGPAPAEETIERAERLANAIVWENRPVTVRTQRPDDPAGGTLRKPVPGGVTEVRLVEVRDFDTVGCCGTHVGAAGEIAVIKILKHEKTKGVHRVYFVCGRRAFGDYAKKHEIVKRLSNRLTTAPEALEEKIEKLQAEGRRSRKDSERLTKKLAGYEAEALRTRGARKGGALCVAEVIAGADEAYLRALSSQLVSAKGTLSVLASEDGLVIGAVSADLDVDLPAKLVDRAKALGGMGGGKGRFAMVRLPQEVAMSDFIRQVLEALDHA